MPANPQSPELPVFQSAADPQIDALLAVFEANLNAAVGPLVPGGVAVRSSFSWPITLQMIPLVKMPALSVFAETARAVQDGKRRHVERAFRAVYWMDAYSYDQIGKGWAVLNPAWETIHATLNGQALYDLSTAPAKRSRPDEILGSAGFTRLLPTSISAAFNFVQNTSAGSAYPLLQVSFNAVHEPSRGSWVYDPSKLPPLTAFHALLNERERASAAQPAVEMEANV